MQTYHLYSDGNYFPRAKKSGFGGYIESPTGEILVEYTEQIKQPEYAHSFELLGIIRGLQIAKNKGIESIVSHCDDKNTSSKLIEIFEEKIYNVSPSGKPELYDQIIELSKSFKKIKFEYIPRALNKHADSLSRRYASLMESNFLRQYGEELDFAQKKFDSGVKTNKRIFFSHDSIVRNPFKNNPFLVAQYRNKKVRKISREEQKKPYEFFYTEIFKDNDEIVMRGFYYDKAYKLIEKFEEKYHKNSHHLDQYCSFLSDKLQKVKEKYNVEDLWIDSNHRALNSYFEQKEKIPSAHWDSFLNVYNSLGNFSNVFFHHFPFDHKFSPEIVKQETQKQELDTDIEGLDSLLEKLGQGRFAKDTSKCFGDIIRHTLRDYKQKLERELDDIEKNQIIEQTAAHLVEKGYKNIPSFKKGR